jgi:flavin-dependent dehydrogenase
MQPIDQTCAIAIVGGGPAGLATALFLADADPHALERIVVLEKESYPRDKICGGAIAARADDLLATIGVRVEVPDVVVDGFSVKSTDVEVCERRGQIGRVVRRIEFDHALARIARVRGVRIEEGARVSQLQRDDHGVTIETARGTFRAQAVVGADGVGSIVRRALGVGAGALRAQVIELDTEPVASDRARDLLHFDIADRGFTGYAWDFPTVVDGKALVCRGVYHLKTGEDEVDIRARLAQRLAQRGLDIENYTQKRFAERGFEPHEPYSAPRALLVGEAAGIDAVTGEGIAQAIEYGACAGRYLAEKLARGDFSFRDWPARLAKSKVGIDLRARHYLLPFYFGRHRGWFERHFTMHPEFVAASVEQFAGRSVSQLTWARATASAVWSLASGALRGARNRGTSQPKS